VAVTLEVGSSGATDSTGPFTVQPHWDFTGNLYREGDRPSIQSVTFYSKIRTMQEQRFSDVGGVFASD